MAKRGRPSLNLTPEERIQRRRLQLVASQRKRRAHKRLALQPPQAEPKPKPDPAPNSFPQRPDEAELCRYYDAVFLGQDEPVALSSGSNAIAPTTKATAKAATRPTTRSTTKTSTQIATNGTWDMSCGSAPLDAISETSLASAPLAAVVGPHSRASLLQTTKPRIDTHAPSFRLEAPAVWADYTFVESGKSVISPAVFASEHMAHNAMPLLGSVLDLSIQHGADVDDSHLLGHPATHPNRILIAKDRDNVFSPGRFSTTESEWMPTNSNETPYSHRHIKPYHRRPPSLALPDSGPASSSVEAADLAAPWAGAKQDYDLLREIIIGSSY
ncbi:hypothetical protein V8C44DRAFT_358617 [Trichoderma aethiopicum]